MALTITIDNRLRLPLSGLTPEIESEIKAAFTYDNPDIRKSSRSVWQSTQPTTIHTWRQEEDTLSLPRGGMYKVRGILKAAQVPYQVSDERVEGITAPEEWQGVKHSLSLYDYQKQASQKLIETQNCLLRAPTGSGKTSTATAIIADLKRPTLVIVWTKALLGQWVERINTELGIPKRNIGVIQGKKTCLAPVTVSMQQSLYARHLTPNDPICQYFGVVIADEVQRFAARTLFEAIDPFPAKWRLGISADESRKDKKEFLTYDLFGRVACDIDKNQLIQVGVIHDVQVRIVPTEFQWVKNYEDPQDFNRMSEAMGNDSTRNQIIIDLAKEEALQSRKMIVLSHRVNLCLSLYRSFVMAGIPSGVMTGDTGMTFPEAKEELSNGKILAGIGTIQSLGQGIDLPEVSVGMLVTPLAGNRQLFNQVWGRLCRTSKGKTTARLYYLWDKHVYGLAAIDNLRKWNRDVVVWTPMGWVEANQYLKGIRAYARQYRDGPDSDVRG